MDKRAALKAAAVMVAFLIIVGLVYLAFDGRIWADVVLAVILVGVSFHCCYNIFKD